jgi:hypothetical protein
MQPDTSKFSIPKKVLALISESEAFGLETVLSGYGFNATAILVNPSIIEEIKHRLAVGDSETIDIGDLELVEDRDMNTNMIGFRYGDPAENNLILCRLV